MSLSLKAKIFILWMILFCISAYADGPFVPPVPGISSPLTSDLTGGTKGLTGINYLGYSSTASTLAGYNNDFWVSAIRTDGKAGSGTHEDPFDGSTAAKFDAIQNTYLTSNSHEHLFGGTFLTYGSPSLFSGVSKGWQFPSGAVIEGSGKGITIVKQFALPDNGIICPIQTLSQVENDYNQILNLTIDANAENLIVGQSAPTTSVANCWEIDGSFWRVENVDEINFYGNFANNEETFAGKAAFGQISSVPQPMQGGMVLNCSAHSFAGDYGYAFCFIGTIATGSAEAPNLFIGNYAYGLLGGTTSGSIGSPCEMFGWGGNDIIATNNTAKDCWRFAYSEGPFDKTTIADNHVINGYAYGILLNASGSNIGPRTEIRNNTIELNTTPVGGGSGGDNKQAIGGINGSITTNSGYLTINGNHCYRKVTGVSTASRARTSNVATVNFPSATNFNNNDKADITGFTDSTFNANAVTLTKVSSTQYTYPNTGSNVTTTTDTSGVVNSVTYGIALTSNQSGAKAQVFDNQIDDTMYNSFIYTYPVDLIYYNNLTLNGAPLTLIPSSFHALPSKVTFPAQSDPVANGNNLIAAYAHAALIYPNTAAPTATSPVVIYLEPGNYNLGSQTLAVNTNYVDMIGLGQREEQYIYSSSNAVTTTANIFRWKNLYFATTSSSSSVYAWNHSYGGGGTTETVEDCEFQGAGTYNSISDTGSGNHESGTYRRDYFVNGGFFGQGQGQFDGLAEDCQIGSNGTDNVYTSGIIRRLNCAGQLNLFRNDGVIESSYIKASGTNKDAIYEQNNGANGGITRYTTLIPTGTATAYKNGGGARTTSIYHCNMPVTKDTSITNSLGTDAAAFNSVNTLITQ